MMLIDDIFEMGSGYVLNFSDRTIAQFFAEELNIDFDDPAYQKNGTSKAKRLRCFLQTVDKPTVIRTLEALWEYREATRFRSGKEEKIQNAHGRLLAIIHRLREDGRNGDSATHPAPAFERAVFGQLCAELQSLALLEAQPRGCAFEAFLIKLFNTFKLEARDPFRLRGEQIDGSFLLANETYLMEAKWQNAPSGIADLHGFHGKLEQKAAWTRGLLISNSGFSEDGLHAFGEANVLFVWTVLISMTLSHANCPLDMCLKARCGVLQKRVSHSHVYGTYFQVDAILELATHPNVSW
jgi:hypothetical protein